MMKERNLSDRHAFSSEGLFIRVNIPYRKTQLKLINVETSNKDHNWLYVNSKIKSPYILSIKKC